MTTRKTFAKADDRTSLSVQDLEVTRTIRGPQFERIFAAIDGLVARNETVTLGNSVLRGLDPIPDNAEHFDLSQPDCKSTLGREPTTKDTVFFPAKLKDEVGNEYDNLWSRWADLGTVAVFKATTNLVASPEDLTTSPWANWNSTDSLSSYYWHGRRFSLVTTTGGSGNVYQDPAFTGDGVKSFSCTMKKGASAASQFGLYDTAAPAWRLLVTVTWATKSVSVSVGTSFSVHWYGDEIVEVRAMSTSITAANTNRLYCYGEKTGGASSGSTYFTAVQAEDSTYPTPYTPTSRAAGELKYSYQWSSVGAIECWVRPWSKYDSAKEPTFWAIRGSGLQFIQCYYSPSTDKIRFLIYKDASNWKAMSSSSAFSSDATFNTWIHIKCVWNLSTGTCSLYQNGVLQTAEAGAGSISTTAPQSVLHIGGFDTGTWPGYELDGLITDLLIWDTADTSTDHYTKGVPWYDPSEVTNKYRSVRINRYGMRMHNSSLTITDDYNRLIDISNRTGLLAKDAAGKVIHDIPNAPILSGMRYGGHVCWKDAATYISTLTLSYTDTNTTRTASSSVTNVDLSSVIPQGMTNIHGALVTVSFIFNLAAAKVAVGTAVSMAAVYSTSYNTTPANANGMAALLQKAMVASVAFTGSIAMQAQVPVFWVAGVPYFTYQLLVDFGGSGAMASGNANYLVTSTITFVGPLV